MSFDKVLRDAFPGALDEREFTRATRAALGPRGFTRESTIACVATCRDEISQSLTEHVTEHWGLPFNLAGLGGMIFAGKVGFGAAEAHAPQRDGKERYLFLAAPHVAIGPGGEQGVCEREGRSGPSTACGALMALLGELREGRPGPTDDPDDVEQGLIRKRLGGRAPSGGSLDLFGLTGLAHDVILEDLERLATATVDTSKADYAVITGIQIHGPGDPVMRNYIQPRTLYAVVGGSRSAVTLSPDMLG